MSGAALTPRGVVDKAGHALLFGNFAVGTGVMVATAVLNDLFAALQLTVATAGLRISLAAGSMARAYDLAWLLPVRVVCVLGATIFTAQAAPALAPALIVLSRCAGVAGQPT